MARADENRREGAEPRRAGDQVTSEERKSHSDDGDHHRDAADPDQFRQIGLESDFEEEQQHADLGDEENARGQRDETEERWTEEHAGRELA